MEACSPVPASQPRVQVMCSVAKPRAQAGWAGRQGHLEPEQILPREVGKEASCSSV